MRLDLDTPVHCLDGAFGGVTDVVIDPGARRLTHLVVQPHHHPERARLVPIEGGRVREESDRISIQHTITEIRQLEPIQSYALMRAGEFVVGDSDWDVGIQDLSALPDYGGLGPEAPITPALDYEQYVTVGYHRIPKGDVEIRRESSVTSSDGHHLGHIVGFVIDDREQIVHLILAHGHLWGKRHVAVPGDAI